MIKTFLGFRQIIWIPVLFTQVVELGLLQYKYDLFTGGFLQPFSYLTWPDRAAFIALSLWFDFFFWGALGVIWFKIARKCKINYLPAACNFIFASCVAMGVWVGIKFKVLSYFNDTLNFLIIRNLGGGNLMEALAYVANEASAIVIGILVLTGVYFIGFRAVRLKTVRPSFSDAPVYGKINIWLLIPVVLVTISLCYHANKKFELRYGLSRKTSFILLTSFLDNLTDFDRDGFGFFSHVADDAPLEDTIYPGALDIPGNGKDENGFAGDFVWRGPPRDTLAVLPTTPFGDHILLIVLESGRGDLVGKKWEEQTVAPNIMALAQSGTSVKYAYSHTGYTTSSIKALFNRSLSTGKNRFSFVDFLDRTGYGMSFFSGQDESFGGVASSVGMDRKGRYLFDARSAVEDRVFPSKASGSLRLSEERIVRQFIAKTAEINWNTPQFFYINLQAAHFSYSHPKMPGIINDNPIPRSEICAMNQQWLEATYWNAVAVADQAIGKIIAHLKHLGVYENTVVMITGDHGESLFDDGFLGHGHALNETQTLIPLVINRPGLSIRSAVGQMDMGELLAQVATGQFNSAQWDDRDKAVLQIIGSLQQPQLIGIVSHGAVRTVLDFRTRKVFFSDLKCWKDFDQAWNDVDLSKRVKTLIEKWETACWENHVSKKI